MNKKKHESSTSAITTAVKAVVAVGVNRVATTCDNLWTGTSQSSTAPVRTSRKVTIKAFKGDFKSIQLSKDVNPVPNYSGAHGSNNLHMVNDSVSSSRARASRNLTLNKRLKD